MGTSATTVARALAVDGGGVLSASGLDLYDGLANDNGTVGTSERPQVDDARIRKDRV